MKSWSKTRNRPPAPAPAQTPAAAPPSPAPAVRAWRPHAIALAVLCGLALAAYANSFRAGLVFDNSYVIVQDARVHQVTAENLGLILSRSYWYKTSISTLYRPLTTFSYLFNYAILGNGAAPAGYHALNLALHALNIALVYWVGWLVFAEFWPAFAMAGLWAVHPALTESVTNIVGRADLLAAFGVLAGLVCYARSVTAPGRQAAGWQAGLLAASAIGIFSKESAIVLMAAIFLYDIGWCVEAPWRARAAGYLAAALPIVAFLAIRSHVLASLPEPAIAYTDNPLVGADFLTARLTAIGVLGKYLWLLIWPARLSCDYSYNQIPLVSLSFGHWQDWQAIAALAVYAAAAVLAAVCYRRGARLRARPAFFTIGFFLAAMAPTANLFLLIGTMMAERLLYLPAVGFLGCVAWAGWRLYRLARPRWPAVRIALPAALAAVLLALSGRTFARNSDWRDERSLWLSAARTSPASYKPHHNLASLLASPPHRDLDAAVREADLSLAVQAPLAEDQRVAPAYATAGWCYRLKADALGPDGGAAWRQKALATLLEGERVDEAENREIARRNRLEGKTVGPVHWIRLYIELSRTYRALGQYQNALDALTVGRSFDPQAEYFEELAQNYRALGDPPQAAISLLEGITMGANDQVRLAAEVVDLYRQTAPESCALAGDGPQAALNFNCPLVRSQVCAAGRNVALLYRQLGRESEAQATASSAVSTLGCPPEMFR